MKRSEVNRDELSPMMQQYMEIKDRYPEELLFFRLGDFYELFFEDGITASQELELTLTGKNAGLKERVPMCGVPHHAVKSYIEKLVNRGYKVAICEQLEDPRFTKNMVKRDVIEVVTKGTIVDLEFLNAHDFNYIGGIIDYNYIYLLTYIDISTGEVNATYLKHDADTLLNSVLNLNLKEVIVPSNFSVDIINIMTSKYDLNVSHNDELLEDEYASIYANVSDERIVMGIKNLLYYLRVKELKDLTHLTPVQVLKNDDYLIMDVHTVRNLELIETLRLKERKYSLIWLIDKTKTAMGSRALKNWLMYPLKDKVELNRRYDYIECLNNQFLLREELRTALSDVYDLERLCGKVICGSLNARDVLQIKRSLKSLPKIREILDQLHFAYPLEEHQELCDLLERAIYEDPPITIKEGYLIKEGYSAELDELKSIRSGGKDFISNIESSLREQTGIQNLRVGFNKVFGYYIEITKGQIDKIDPSLGWERRQTLTGAERYITPELKEKEALVLNAEEKIIDLEYQLFIEVKNAIRKEIFKLKQTAHVLSQIDALASLSIVAEEQHFVRPTLTDEPIIEIRDGSHPVVQEVSDEEYIKNDIIMDRDTSTLLITGPNMSGKSTYMRQLAITIILAQMGSFVPARECTIPIFDHIYTRIGASDDLVSGESTFMVEMLEAKNAIVNATANSLILFDELGRGTATYDGMSLARAILEYVNDNIKCKTLFSTHYHELTDLANQYPSIKNVHVEAVEENGNVTFLHKVSAGAIDKSYGVHVAKLAGLPESLLKRANEILKNYEDKEPKYTPKIMQMALDFDEKPDEVYEIIKKIDPLNTTPMEALNYLFELKEKINHRH